MVSRQYFSLKRPETCFGLALLAHLLAVLSYSAVIILHPDRPTDEDTAIYLPAYVYHEQQPVSQPQAAAAQSTPVQKSTPKADIALQKIEEQPTQKPDQGKTQTADSAQAQPQPNLFLNQNASPYSQAPNFVKNKNVSKPLLKLLTAATAAHFSYPPIAQDFRMTGSARVRFLLHPDGQVTDVTLEKSSGAGVLDEAALATIRAISPVGNVSTYITEPQYIEANLIFA